MAIVQINIPEKLWERLQQTGRPVEEVVVETLEKAFDGDLAPTKEEPSKEDIIRRLEEAGYLSDPSVWDGPDAKAWRDLPEEEKQQHIQEAAEMYFPDSPASRAVIRNRKRLDTGLSRAEVAQRLIRMGFVRDPKEWDTLAARRWEKLPETEKQKFIDEMNQMFFADSPASTYITENRR